MSEEQKDQVNEEQAMPEIKVLDLTHYVMMQYASMAWVNLGVQINRATGDLKTDLSEARLAIDGFGALVRILEGKLEPHEMRDLQNMLTTLQMNYAQRAAAAKEEKSE
ncbi:MAG: DUF1844 domain-containing protein [bacterium]